MPARAFSQVYNSPTTTTTVDYPPLTPEQHEYVAGWKDPAEARRRRIEALATICEGLFPAIYTLDIAGPDRSGVYDDALRLAGRSPLHELAWAGGLDGTAVFNECGKPTHAVVRLGTTTGPDPMLRMVSLENPEGGGNGALLSDFVDSLVESYVGRPKTKQYGEAALAELARDWLSRQA
jgi:hypothetical protein